MCYIELLKNGIMGAAMGVRYLDRKDAIRSELLRCAQNRKTIS
jgi:hypothetical protein